MFRLLLVTFILSSHLSALAEHRSGVATDGTITNTSDLAKVLNTFSATNIPFNLTVSVISPVKNPTLTFAAEDSSGRMLFRRDRSCNKIDVRQGDLIRIKGSTKIDPRINLMFAAIGNIEVLSHSVPPSPIEIDWSDIRKGECNIRLVKAKGIVHDAFRDEIDRRWDYVQLKNGQESIFACVFTDGTEQDNLRNLIGAEVSVIGIYMPHRGMRRILGNTIYVTSWDDFKVTKPTHADLFDVPSLKDIPQSVLPNLNTAGRRRTAGKVIAVWHDDRILLRTADDSIVRVDLTDGNPPKYGDFVEVAGRPETDLYRLNLSRGIWRPFNDAGQKRSDETPEDVTVRNLTMTAAGELAFQTKYHGKAIRMKGRVISVPPEGGYNQIVMDCDKQMVRVDAGSCPESLRNVEVDCTISAAGTCLMDTGNWHPNAPFPHIEGFSIIVRTPADIKILAYPPWWTAGRLSAVIGALLGLLSGIFIWNRMLNRLAERRGRELADEKLAHVTSDLKVYERTRLAVELHDSLSQNLTGVSLAIRAANRLADSDSDGMRQSLNVAAKALDSCRDELRNCLWDLRNQTLEETDMNEAIRQTLAPHIGDNTKLSVRFNVSRERLSDNTAHCILRIIRELVSNAVRHGGASAIKIAGSIEEDRLLFSVCDNGCGFDPDSRPNAADGHFGLQGIQDRVDGFEGELSIKSAPDAGAKVTVSIKVNIPKQAD